MFLAILLGENSSGSGWSKTTEMERIATGNRLLSVCYLTSLPSDFSTEEKEILSQCLRSGCRKLTDRVEQASSIES